RSQTYNIVATTSGTDTPTLRAKLGSVPGVLKSRIDTFTPTLPAAINGKPLQNVLPAGSDRQTALGLLSSMEGYDLLHVTPSLTVVQGRNVDAGDVGTNN